MSEESRELPGRWSRNKRDIGLDVSHATGKQILERLIGRSDVLISNYRPGVMSKLGEVSQIDELALRGEVSGRGLQLIRASIVGAAQEPVQPRLAISGLGESAAQVLLLLVVVVASLLTMTLAILMVTLLLVE